MDASCGRLVLRDLWKDEVIIDGVKVPIQGGFRGFKNVPQGQHTIENHGVKTTVTINEADEVHVLRLDDKNHKFVVDPADQIAMFKRMAGSGSMDHVLLPFPAEGVAHMAPREEAGGSANPNEWKEYSSSSQLDAIQGESGTERLFSVLKSDFDISSLKTDCSKVRVGGLGEVEFYKKNGKTVNFLLTVQVDGELVPFRSIHPSQRSTLASVSVDVPKAVGTRLAEGTDDTGDHTFKEDNELFKAVFEILDQFGPKDRGDDDE